MANLEIKIEKRKFVGLNFVNGNGLLNLFKSNHIIANGWKCEIFHNGKIYCEAEEEYEDGNHFIKYVIEPNGAFQLRLRKPGEKETKIIKKGSPIVSKGEKVSISSIILTDGYIDDRKGTFITN